MAMSEDYKEMKAVKEEANEIIKEIKERRSNLGKQNILNVKMIHGNIK
jgi:hypothetical protein